MALFRIYCLITSFAPLFIFDILNFINKFMNIITIHAAGQKFSYLFIEHISILDIIIHVFRAIFIKNLEHRYLLECISIDLVELIVSADMSISILLLIIAERVQVKIVFTA